MPIKAFFLKFYDMKEHFFDKIVGYLIFKYKKSNKFLWQSNKLQSSFPKQQIKSGMIRHSEPPSGSQASPSRLSTKDNTRLKLQIDALIQNDISILSRHPYTMNESLLTTHNNPLILHYIRNIYQQYEIKDPLPERYATKSPPRSPEAKQLRGKKKIVLFKKNIDLGGSRQSQNSIRFNYFQTEGKNRYDRTVEKQRQLSPDEIGSEFTSRKGYFPEQSTVKKSGIYFTEYKTVPTEQSRKDTHKKVKPSKIIKLTQINQMESVDQKIEEGQFKLPNTPVSKLLKGAQADSSPIKGIKRTDSTFKAPDALPEILPYSTPREEIKESFRYCIGCDKALLEVNIAIHQKKCKQFQAVLQMPIIDIVRFLKQKINRYEVNIQRFLEQLMKAQPGQMSDHSQKLLQESRKVIGSGQFTTRFENQYSSVLSMSTNWCIVAEQINKVNWFLRIRQKLKQSFFI